MSCTYLSLLWQGPVFRAALFVPINISGVTYFFMGHICKQLSISAGLSPCFTVLSTLDFEVPHMLPSRFCFLLSQFHPWVCIQIFHDSFLLCYFSSVLLKISLVKTTSSSVSCGVSTCLWPAAALTAPGALCVGGEVQAATSLSAGTSGGKKGGLHISGGSPGIALGSGEALFPQERE